MDGDRFPSTWSTKYVQCFCCNTEEAEFPAPRSFVEFLSFWFTPTKKNSTSVSTTGFPPPAAVRKSWGLRSATWHFHLDDFGSLATYEEMGCHPQCWDFVHQVVVDVVMLETFLKGIFKEILFEGEKIQDSCCCCCCWWWWWWFIVSKDEGCRWRMVRIRTKQILLFAVMGGGWNGLENHWTVLRFVHDLQASDGKDIALTLLWSNHNRIQ